MEWKAVSDSGNGRRNDDVVRVWEHGGVVDVMVLDGATSLAERDYIDAVDGDPAWFVRAFAEAYTEAFTADPASLVDEDQEALVQRTLARVREVLAMRGGHEGAPLYAWPIAALSWVRIRPDAGGYALASYCLGDCKLLLGEPDGALTDLDPYDNAYEHHLQGAVAALVVDGLTDPAARFAALTPQLRRRREEQQTAAAPEVLCLAPHGAFGARRAVQRARAGALLLAMTDGYYRLVDPYAMYDDAGLLRTCAQQGPEALLAELRRFEAARDTAELSVKGADDASALALRLPA